MTNDLISRKYMKEAIEQFFVREKYYHPYSKGRKTIPTEEVLDIIDTAPTVKTSLSLDNISDEDIEKFKLIWQRATSKGLPLIVERPQGEWIYDDLFNNWKCSVCGECPKTIGYVGNHDFMKEHFKFCNHCGADMRKGGAE